MTTAHARQKLTRTEQAGLLAGAALAVAAQRMGGRPPEPVLKGEEALRARTIKEVRRRLKIAADDLSEEALRRIEDALDTKMEAVAEAVDVEAALVRVAQSDRAGALQAHKSAVSESFGDIQSGAISTARTSPTPTATQSSRSWPRATLPIPDNAEWQRDLIVSHWKLAEVAEAQDGQQGNAQRHYRAALDIAVALRDSGRLAPVDGWMVEELEARLERVSGGSAPQQGSDEPGAGRASDDR